VIVIGVLVVLVVAGTIWLAVRGGSSTPQPTTAPTSDSSVSASQPSESSLEPPLTLTVSSLPTLVGSDPTESTIGAGSTDPEGFAQRVATSLLAYDWQTDFQVRNDDLMLLAAPDPYGDASGLSQDIDKLTPTGAALSSIQQEGSAVTFGDVTVDETTWARQRIEANGAPAGVHGIDVSGVQTFKESGQTPTSAPVTISMVVVCPPTTTVCTLTRIYSGTLQSALGG